MFTVTFQKGELAEITSAMSVAATFLKVSSQCDADTRAAECLKKMEEKIWDIVERRNITS